MRAGMVSLAVALCVTVAAAEAKNDAGVSLLSQADLDPALVLPPPPRADGPGARAELVELHAMQAGRTPAMEADARRDGDTKDASIFAGVLGARFDLKQLPETAKLFALVRATEKQVVDLGKGEFKRPRPWIVDATIASCSRSDEPLSSYPSGHTSMAFSMAGVLAQLVPGQAGPILARAARYGESRIICEQHFRSDVTAGEALGLLIAERLMAKPAFRTQFNAARAELAAGGFETH